MKIRYILSFNYLPGPTSKFLAGAIIIILLLVLNWLLVRHTQASKKSRGIFSPNLLNFIRQSAIPCAVFHKDDFTIGYLNTAFATIWNIKQNYITAQGLFTINDPILLSALKQVDATAPTLTIEHTIGNGYDQSYYSSMLEFFDEGDGYIMQTMYDITQLKTHAELLDMEINTKKLEHALLMEEIMLTGQELEICYVSLESEKTRLLNILEQTPVEIDNEFVGYWTLDLIKMEIVLSKGARRIFGLSESDNISGEQIIELIDEHHRQDLNKALTDIMAGVTPYYYNLMVAPADGQPAKWISGSVTISLETANKPVQLKGIIIVGGENDGHGVRQS